MSASPLNQHVVTENMVGGSNMIVFPLGIADSERDMPQIKPRPQGCHTSALTTDLQEFRSELS